MSRIVKGVSSEYEVIADLIRQGYAPCIPTMPDTPFDLLAVRGNDILKIQVKSGEFEGNRITIHFRKSNGSIRNYTREEVDYIAVHDRETRRTAYVPYVETTRVSLYKEVPARAGSVRRDEVRLFEDFLYIGEYSA